MIYNYFSPDTTDKIFGHVAIGASNIFNKASTLINFGCGEEEQRNQFFAKIQEEYIDEEMGTLNRKGQKYLNKPNVKKLKNLEKKL